MEMVVGLRFNFALPLATVRVSGGNECCCCFRCGREIGEARAAVVHGVILFFIFVVVVRTDDKNFDYFLL